MWSAISPFLSSWKRDPTPDRSLRSGVCYCHIQHLLQHLHDAIPVVVGASVSHARNSKHKVHIFCGVLFYKIKPLFFGSQLPLGFNDEVILKAKVTKGVV